MVLHSSQHSPTHYSSLSGAGRPRVIFMGTPEYAVPSLEALNAIGDLVAVYSRPDARSKRGNTLIPSPVSAAAHAANLPVFTPETLRNAQAQQELASLRPDLIVVAAYGLLLPPQVLALPRLGTVNLHASLLPRWRGAAPIQRAILAGDTQTGVCLMQVEEGLDTGAYALSFETHIAHKTLDELTHELADHASQILVEAYPQLVEGTLAWTPQDESLATYAHKIDRTELRLNPLNSPEALLRKARASSDSAPCECSIAGKEYRVSTLACADFAAFGLEQPSPGRLAVSKRHVLLGCKGGAVELMTVRPAGKKDMSGADCARGQHWETGDLWQ